MGITTGLVAVFAMTLAGAPLVPGAAVAASSGDGTRITTSATPGSGAQAERRASKPVVRKVQPSSGPTEGGFDVVIKGKRLTGVKRVLFGDVQATDVRSKGGRKLTVKAPPHAAGEVRVRVVTKHGASKRTRATRFTYAASAPSLTRVSPAAGPTSGGTRVTLTGAHLTGATSVRFGTVGATSIVVQSPTTIVATSPAHAVGKVNVSVTTAGGSASVEEAFAYTAAPVLDFVDPGSGPLLATPVTLVGTGLTADAQVTFGGTPATIHTSSPDATELTVTTPGHAAGFVDVKVTTNGGTTTLVNGYRYVGGTTLTSVTPSAGPSSGGSTVTLSGTGFTGDTLVTFGNKPSLSVFANLAGTQLTALLPSHAAGVVDVSVATEGGSATLAGGFTYVDAPTLTSVSPTTGPTSGGTLVTLTGTLFRAGMQVHFGGVLATGVTVVSATQATALTPAHAAGGVDVSVTTPGGTSSLPGAFTYVAVPTLSEVSPDEGPATGGQTVTLTGTNFRAGMQVRFGGTLAVLVSVHPSGTLATVTTPAHAAGLVDVSVTTPGGAVTLAGAYTYVVAPTLTALSPDVGPTGGGTTVTLTGSGFRADMDVRFGGTLAAVDSVNPTGTSATVITPTHAAGLVAVSVTTPGGTATLAGSFTYLGAPTLTAVSPSEGSTAGGESVTLTGTGFRVGMQVRFGGALAALVSVNPGGTSATVTTPPHAAGVVDVSVTTPGGSASFPGGYTYVSAPTVTGVNPDAGPITGGQTVTLTGTGFRAGMQVSFGGTAATGLTILTPSQATVVTPAHTAGVVDVVVSTPGGTGTLSNGYSYVVAPTVTAVSPDEGPTSGGTPVTLTGTGFRAGMTVSFGGTPATGVVVGSPTSATAVTPAHVAGDVNVVVSTTGGSNTLTDGFTYVVSPTVTAVSPDEGPTTGAQPVTLTGTGFRAGMTVSFGGTPATDVVVGSATSATAVTPAHVAGDVNVVVSTPGGSDTLTDGYTYVVAPTVSAVTPDSGSPAGGTAVTLTGTGFRTGIQVDFGGQAATDVVVLSATELTATTPAHSAGLVDVEVSTTGGSGTLSNGFTYVAAPTITGVDPFEGPTTGGTTVTITGTHLTGTTGVNFGGLPATDVDVVNDSTVTAKTPAHPEDFADVEVTTPGGTATLAFGFTYVAPPTLTSASPNAGPVAGGTSVTLVGSNAGSATAVEFGGVPATNLNPVGANAIVVTAPPHVAGAVDIVLTTSGGSATLVNGYTYVPPPDI